MIGIGGGGVICSSMPNKQHTAIHQPSRLRVKFFMSYLLYKQKAPTDILEAKRPIHTTLSNTLRSPAHVGPNPDGGDAKPQGEGTQKATTEISFLTI